MSSNEEDTENTCAFSVNVTPARTRILTFKKAYGDIIIRTPDGRIWIYKDDGWEEEIDESKL
jgi:hypothetical protein